MRCFVWNVCNSEKDWGVYRSCGTCWFYRHAYALRCRGWRDRIVWRLAIIMIGNGPQTFTMKAPPKVCNVIKIRRKPRYSTVIVFLANDWGLLSNEILVLFIPSWAKIHWSPTRKLFTSVGGLLILRSWSLSDLLVFIFVVESGTCAPPVHFYH